MTQPTFDVIVVGLGAMGSSTLLHLASRGQRVLGIDRFAPPHQLGSTHGRTRIIREAYFEHPLYVPLVQRAYENWAALERDAGERRFHQTGGLMIGAADGVLVSGARRSAETHGLPHEMLTAAELRRRWPVFAPAENMVALHEPRAGILFPERCVAACLTLARARGAELRVDEPMLRWRAGDGDVAVTTASGTYRAGRLILAAGPWLPTLVPDVELPLTIERQLFHWFEPLARAAEFGPDRCPIVLWEFEPHRLFAIFPDFGDGLKIGVHHEGASTSAQQVDRTITPEEDAAVRALLERWLPDAAGALRESRVCLYTNTPDEHFLIDRHPAHPEVILASPCSGHGFKFASAIGEVLADLATTGASRFDLAPFAMRGTRPAPVHES